MTTRSSGSSTTLGQGTSEIATPVCASLTAVTARPRQPQLRLAPDDAADTYSALANPDIYLLLVDHFGWTAERYRTWLLDTTARLPLPDRDPSTVNVR